MQSQRHQTHQPPSCAPPRPLPSPPPKRTRSARTARAADAVHVVFRTRGHVIVNDQLDVLHICRASKGERRQRRSGARGRVQGASATPRERQGANRPELKGG